MIESLVYTRAPKKLLATGFSPTASLSDMEHNVFILKLCQVKFSVMAHIQECSSENNLGKTQQSSLFQMALQSL